MNVYELKLKIFLLKDIDLKSSREKICSLIDKSFVKTEKMAEKHKENKFKFYCFNNMYPLERDKIYKAGNIYTILIRTVDKEIENYFKLYLTNEYTDELKALTLESRCIPKKHIEKIYNITPAVAKFNNGYWKDNKNLEMYEKRLVENLIKKYNIFFNTKIDEDFELFTHIKFENVKPIPCDYKNIVFLGDKMTLTLSENENAQKLANIAIGCGLMEMGSRGFGFCNYKWL